MFLTILLGLLALAAAGYWFGRVRAVSVASGRLRSLHSLPAYHGAYVALWAGLPSLLLVLVWLSLQGPVIDALLIQSLPASIVADADAGHIDLILSEIKSVSRGQIFDTPGPEILAAAERYGRWGQIAQWSMVASAAALAIIALLAARGPISARFRARNRVERIVTGLLIFSSVVAIVTTAGIVLSLLFEAGHFFRLVPWHDFFFGLRWEPQIAIRADQIAGAGAFGAIPVFAGTLLIAFIAMAVAAPVGLLSAIYLAEYADARVHAVVKPLLEILAGIPTVVYGFFAVLTVAPALRQFGETIGIAVAPNSALAAGAVMGIMIIPFVSSFSDDALNAVPQAMRDGSYALGATQAETIKSVLIPAALPGIVGGLLLAVSRAIGETMIVVMAAGLIATLTANPLEGVTTVTVQIVTLLIGDTEFDSPKTLAAFALGLVLFFATLALNVLALHIVRKYREQYE
jgi:phosphate transport system permease protein